MATLYVMAKGWKELKNLSTGKWIYKSDIFIQSNTSQQGKGLNYTHH